jgi:hypothetical protein
VLGAGHLSSHVIWRILLDEVIPEVMYAASAAHSGFVGELIAFPGTSYLAFASSIFLRESTEVVEYSIKTDSSTDNQKISTPSCNFDLNLVWQVSPTSSRFSCA